MYKRKTVVDESTGEVIDTETGYVVEDKISEKKPTVASYEHDGFDKIHTHPENPNHHDLDLGSKIPHSTKDGLGKSLNAEQVYFVNKIRMWERRLRVNEKFERRLSIYFDIVNQYVEIFHMPKHVALDIRNTLRKLEKLHILKGKPASTVVPVVYFICVKKNGQQISFQTVKPFLTNSKGLFNRYFYEFKQALKINIPELTSAYDHSLDVFCKKLGVTIDTQKLAFKMLEYCKKHDLIQPSPNVLAATLLYIADLNTDRRLSQQEIADVCKVSNNSISLRKHNLNKLGHILKLRIHIVRNIANYRNDMGEINS